MMRVGEGDQGVGLWIKNQESKMSQEQLAMSH